MSDTDRTITRRGALGRLLALGAGATAAVVAPDVILAAPEAPAEPVAPTLPEWLSSDPELTAAFERLVQTLPLLPPDGWLARAARDWVFFIAERVEIAAGLREETPAPPRPEPAPERPRARILADNSVATVRFDKLDRNAGRRARRWFARQPVGAEHPTLRLRRGSYRDEKPYDFLDVAMPQRYHSLDDSALIWAERVFDGLRSAVGPAIGAHTVLCGHYGRSEAGAHTVMAVYPDGRNAVYVHEAMA